MKTPIIILTKERPDQFKEMVRSIVEHTDKDTYKLIFCDNDSTCPKMKNYLKELEADHTVIYNRENKGFEGFNSGLELVDTDFFLMSDPDIIMNPKLPEHWILRLQETLSSVMMPKIGLALNIEFKKDTHFSRRIRHCEEHYWKDTLHVPGIKAPCYLAPVDTTMAMYRRDTYSYWNMGMKFDRNHGINDDKQIRQSEYSEKYFMPTARVAGDYTATHTGWDVEDKYLEDQRYYAEHCDLSLASTTKWWVHVYGK